MYQCAECHAIGPTATEIGDVDVLEKFKSTQQPVNFCIQIIYLALSTKSY
jgi:hypothetical protein